MDAKIEQIRRETDEKMQKMRDHLIGRLSQLDISIRTMPLDEYCSIEDIAVPDTADLIRSIQEHYASRDSATVRVYET